MAIKLVEVVTYYERLPSIKLHNPLNKLPYEISWQIKNVLFLPVPEATRVGRVVSYSEGLPTIKSHDHLNKWLWFCGYGYLILYITIPVVTIFDRVVTYGEKLPPIKSHDTLITWSNDYDSL